MFASGLRSSWAASATNARCRARAAASRSSMPFRVTASRWISSRAGRHRQPLGAGRPGDLLGARGAAPRPAAGSRRSPARRHGDSASDQQREADQQQASAARRWLRLEVVDRTRGHDDRLAVRRRARRDAPRPAAGRTGRTGCRAPRRTAARRRGPGQLVGAAPAASAGRRSTDAVSTRPARRPPARPAAPAPAPGRGSRPASTSAATVAALARASASTDRCERRGRARRQQRGRRAASAHGQPATPISISRARSAQPAPPGHGPSRRQPVAAPRTVSSRVAAELAAQVSDVDLDDVGCGLVRRVPDVVEQLGPW